MPHLHSHRHRPVHLGPLPVERLPRSAGAPELPARQPGDAEGLDGAGEAALRAVLPEYRALFAPLLDGASAPARAPMPADPQARADHLKAAACFLDATLAGVCTTTPADWLGDSPPAHSHALVLLVEFGREPLPGDPGEAWIRGSNAARTDLRCAELAVVLAGYLRTLGWQARGHVAGATQIDLPRLAQRAGLCLAVDGVLAMPFLARGFRIAVVSTDCALAADLPIAPGASLVWPDDAAAQGAGGTRPASDEAEQARRPLHLGRYPMERIPRVDAPTTLVLRDAIQRVPKRADLFTRALAGDLGPRAQAERPRFAVKHPLAQAMLPLIRGMVPLQGTRAPLAPSGIGGPLADAQHNADAVKALAYFMGADLAGICAAEPWMYYSHDEAEGRPIDPYHPTAIVLLIDQGFETMEGASGDDWISGAQSMRGYMRGALIAGVLAAQLRRLGHSARVHSNAHSEVLHLPAMLMAGLGELSRIGEVVLNPFIGPRSKSVLVTTSLPLAHDRPIDFGLQAMCEACNKCATECPCNAIPFGPKVMFNGYEIWKPDVEKCGKYRLTNMKGSACGRCMKTCPYNREDLADSDALLWATVASPAGPASPADAAARQAFIDHDERNAGGARNPVKRWWWDLEMVGGVAVAPVAGVNERDLSPGRAGKLAATQKLAFFPPALQPAGGTTLASTVPLDRAAGLAAYAAAESPEVARARIAAAAGKDQPAG